MLATTIEPTDPIRRDHQRRSVMFSDCTKDTGRTGKIRHRTTSASVPIPATLFRSPSELQLSMDEKMADHRDYMFYARLVSGIRERNFHAGNHKLYDEETERCLTHIMQTRFEEPQSGVSISQSESSDGDCDENLDCGTSSSSSHSSFSSYQRDFENETSLSNTDDTTYEENECIFELEL